VWGSCGGVRCTYNCINTSLCSTESGDPLVVAAVIADVADVAVAAATCCCWLNIAHTNVPRSGILLTGVRHSQLVSVAAFIATLKQTAACVHKQPTQIHTHTHAEQAAEGATTTTARTGWPGCGRLLSDFNTLRMKIAKRQRHGVDNYPLIA